MGGRRKNNKKYFLARVPRFGALMREKDLPHIQAMVF